MAAGHICLTRLALALRPVGACPQRRHQPPRDRFLGTNNRDCPDRAHWATLQRGGGGGGEPKLVRPTSTLQPRQSVDARVALHCRGWMGGPAGGDRGARAGGGEPRRPRTVVRRTTPFAGLQRGAPTLRRPFDRDAPAAKRRRSAAAPRPARAPYPASSRGRGTPRLARGGPTCP